MDFLSKEEVVRILMSAIDQELGPNYLQLKCVADIRTKIIKQIERDYCVNPLKISDFVNSIDPRLWALKMIASMTFSALSTKKHFGKNGITKTGIIYAQLNCMSVEAAYKYNYIEQSELNIALRNLNELVSCAGYTELFRYNPKDNYLDFDEK